MFEKSYEDFGTFPEAFEMLYISMVIEEEFFMNLLRLLRVFFLRIMCFFCVVERLFWILSPSVSFGVAIFTCIRKKLLNTFCNECNLKFFSSYFCYLLWCQLKYSIKEWKEEWRNTGLRRNKCVSKKDTRFNLAHAKTSSFS